MYIFNFFNSSNFPRLSPDPPSKTQQLILLLQTPTFRKHIPKPQRFVTCARDNGLASGTHRQKQHPESVPNQFRYWRHARIPPHNDLVLTVAMCAHDFVVVPAPREIAHLAPGVDA